MYLDALPATRLAAASTAAEVNAKVAALLAARQAAAAMAREAAGPRAACKAPENILMMHLQPPAAADAARFESFRCPGWEAQSLRGAQGLPAPEEPRGGATSREGELGWLLRNLLCLGSAFMVLYIAMKGAVNLQTSVFEEVGTAGLTSYYAGFLFSNIFLPTITIRWLGCKRTVIVTILAYMPYIAAQLYACYYTLVPGGLLAGLAAGPMWVAQGTYLSHMASLYGARSGTANDVLMVRLFGVFYMLYQMSQVWGNLLSSTVLKQGESASLMLNGTREICGVNFCPASASSKDQLEHGKPAPHHLAIITFSYIACVAFAAAIVYFGVDEVPRFSDQRKSTREAKEREAKGGGGAEAGEGREAGAPPSALAGGGAVGGHGGGYTGQSAMSVLSATLRLTSHVDLLLLVPITAFLGVEDTFLAADYTASYVSCAWGVSNIGYVMICYGVMNSTAALCGGWIVKLTGRLPVVLAGTVLQTAVVAALRLWQPHPNDTTLFFAMAGMWGITDGIWQAQINAMYGILFPGQEEAAYSSFRLWEGVGYILAYSYSSYLCTDYKLYLLFGLMLLGVGGYVTDEVRLRRRAKRLPN